MVSLQETRRGAVSATVRFTTADGRTITTETRPGELVVPPPAVGATIPIVYDPEDPQAMVRDPRAPQDAVTGPVVLVAAGVGGVAVLVLLVRRRRTRGTRPTEG